MVLYDLSQKKKGKQVVGFWPTAVILPGMNNVALID